ncbi:MAG TPA: hypothetical protein PKG73_00165 [bacterium]|nr:hypothetical protein [bacterium]HOH67176.1 hypothetical protein [bacterium]
MAQKKKISGRKLKTTDIESVFKARGFKVTLIKDQVVLEKKGIIKKIPLNQLERFLGYD